MADPNERALRKAFEGNAEPDNPPPPGLHPLKDDEIKSIIRSEIEDAVTYYDTEISSQQRESLRYYFGRPFGNELKGRSKVILTDVRDTIEWIMPTLMRIFFGGRQVVRYIPQGPDDQDGAQQATDYAQFLTKRGNTGFKIMHDWFKDALIEKVGVTTVYYEEKNERRLERYAELEEDELQLLLADDSVEVVRFEEIQKSAEVPDPQTGQPVPTQVTMYNVEVRQIKPKGEIKIDGIPQEEFLIAKRARVMDDDVPFVGRRRRFTFSDLVAMGFTPGFVDTLPGGDSYEMVAEASERDPDGTPPSVVDREDWASREIWLTECYILIDEDGDGYSERRRILVAGDSGLVILEDEEVTHVPFAAICPVPIPHRFYGLSFADLIMDLQLIRSMLLRNMFDNIYLQNNARHVVVEGEVEISDLLESTPGGVVRASSTDAVVPLPTQPLSPMAFNMLEYLHGVKEDRTGITRYNQGRDAETLNQTATGISAIMEAANLRIEMIARIFADGVKRLYEQLLHVMREAPIKDQVIRLRGEWVKVDPRSWQANMDVEVEVGLGTNQMASRVQNMLMLRDLQMQVLEQDPRMVTPENVYEVLERIPEAMGFETEGLFFTPPAGELPPKPPDPKFIEAQVKQQEVEEKRNLEMATLQFRREQMLLEAELKREEYATRIRVAEINAEAMLEVAEENSEAQAKSNGAAASAQEE